MSDDGADDSVAGNTSACTSTSTSTNTSIRTGTSTRNDVHGHGIGGGRYARAFKLDPGKGEDKGEDNGVQSRVPWRRYLRGSTGSSNSSSRDLGWELQSLDDGWLEQQSRLSSRETKTGCSDLGSLGKTNGGAEPRLKSQREVQRGVRLGQRRADLHAIQYNAILYSYVRTICRPRASWRRDAYQRVRKANQGQESDPVERRASRAPCTSHCTDIRRAAGARFWEDCLLRAPGAGSSSRKGAKWV